MDKSSLWSSSERLVLASRSEARRDVLTAAGVPFEVVPIEIDERKLENSLRAERAAPHVIALALACQKAMEGSKTSPGRLILGADQTLSMNGLGFHKPISRLRAAEQLRLLAGGTHELTSAYSFVCDGTVISSGYQSARLTMRQFDDAFINRYLDAAGPAILGCVGAYQIEGIGVHLFTSIEGDHSTIMGLPIFPILTFLRSYGLVES